MTERKFEPGQVVSTPAVVETVPLETLLTCLDRHLRGDWGELNPADRAENDRALAEGDRILSSYDVNGYRDEKVTVWIITEYDRSATTLLFPEDY